MRIGLVAPPWVAVPPPSYGGTEVVVDGLARGLAAAGHDVLLFTVGDSTCPVTRAWRYPSAYTPMGHYLGEAAHVLDAYAAMADRDVVHDHTVLGPLLGRPAGQLVVATCHQALTPDFARVYREVSLGVPLVAISADQRASAPEVSFVAVIHHGLDLDRFTVGAGDGGFLLYMGRMCADKGPDRAARIARRSGMPLVIAAKMREPDEVAFFDAEVRPLLGRGVDFVGEVDAAERLGLLQGARALLNPVRWSEPFGMVMIESLACGTPVLAPCRGSAPEIVEAGRTGALCEDDDDFVDAVGRLDSLDRRACRAAAEDRFSLSRMVEDHLRLYERLGAGPCSRATG